MPNKVTEGRVGEGRTQEIIIDVKIVVPLWAEKYIEQAKEMARSDVEQALTLAIERDGLIASFVVGEVQVK